MRDYVYDRRTAEDGHDLQVYKRRHVDLIIKQTFSDVWFARKA